MLLWNHEWWAAPLSAIAYVQMDGGGLFCLCFWGSKCHWFPRFGWKEHVLPGFPWYLPRKTKKISCNVCLQNRPNQCHSTALLDRSHFDGSVSYFLCLNAKLISSTATWQPWCIASLWRPKSQDDPWGTDAARVPGIIYKKLVPTASLNG